jgi:hypothetical protein
MSLLGAACYDSPLARLVVARMAKLVDARDLKSLTLTGMRVRFPLRAPSIDLLSRDATVATALP